MMTDLLLAAHHPLVGRHRNGYVLGTERNVLGLPNCLPAGLEGLEGLEGLVDSVEGCFLHKEFLRLPHYPSRQCSGSRWTPLLASVCLHAPLPYSACLPDPPPTVLPQHPFPPGRVSGVGWLAGTGLI